MPGKPADVNIVDMNKEWIIDVNKFESKSRNCPFHGWKLKGQAVMTIVAGKIVMRDLFFKFTFTFFTLRSKIKKLATERS